MSKTKLPSNKTIVDRLFDHILGERHELRHRLACGSALMVSGVLLVKICASIHFLEIHFFADVVGYFLHGVGATPFVEYLMKKENKG